MKNKKSLIIILIVLLIVIAVVFAAYFIFFNKEEKKSFFEQIKDMDYSVKVTEYSYVTPIDYKWKQGEQLDIYIHGSEIELDINNVLLINNVIASSDYENSDGSLPIAFPNEDKIIRTIGCLSVFKNSGIVIEVRPSETKDKEPKLYSNIDYLFENYCMPVVEEE